ncbi:hypothetical protein [Paraflavitalea speifideaquila]|uniref:hypothetical protein n=1 Tax=Paraflavitalea speifideaquila TaxID=3076558 RepID=UPI0028EC0A92|nr:hypothetical protein [Paraflavitalea speifideiaquila]
MGANLQSVRANLFFPTTSDLGLSVGYQLNDNSVVGIGASYKVGWGKNINHIRITSEGMGVRSYLDMRLKKSFYASGGFEYNYQPATPASTTDGPDTHLWKQSGLLGISKVISLRSKTFKKNKGAIAMGFSELPAGAPHPSHQISYWIRFLNFDNKFNVN